MALSSPQTNNQLVKFRTEVAYEFLRASRFDPWMGDDTTSVIARVKELNSGGKQINIPLVCDLSGPGVGNGVLSGNEEKLDDYGFPLWADKARNAVAADELSIDDASFNVPSVIKRNLKNWAKRIVRDDIVDALLSIPTATIQAGRGGNPGNRVNGVKWASATSTQKNTFVTNNADRILFGATTANLVAGNAASSLANCDTTNDLFTSSFLDVLKEVAMATTGNKVTPYMTEGEDEEWYVCFVGRRAMRQAYRDTTIQAFNKDARPRESSGVTKSGGNPMFTGGGLVYKGIIIREIPEITDRLLLTGAGASSADVEPVFLCGQGALAYGMQQMPTPTTRQDDDYQNIEGFGIKAKYGVGKIAKVNPTSNLLKDWGMVTGFVATTA